MGICVKAYTKSTVLCDGYARRGISGLSLAYRYWNERAHEKFHLEEAHGKQVACESLPPRVSCKEASVLRGNRSSVLDNRLGSFATPTTRRGARGGSQNFPNSLMCLMFRWR